MAAQYNTVMHNLLGIQRVSPGSFTVVQNEKGLTAAEVEQITQYNQIFKRFNAADNERGQMISFRWYSMSKSVP